MQISRFAHIKSCGLLVFALLSNIAYGQYRAAIQGTVTDISGGIVPGANLTLTNEETGAKQEGKSNQQGFYRFGSLAPGPYSLSVESKGFKKAVREHIDVRAEQLEGVNVSLNPGEVSESVTVSAAEAPKLETETGSIGTTITTQQIQRLPQIGRDPYELVRLTPGIFGLGARNNVGDSVKLPNTAGPGGSNSSIFQTENQLPMSANGQRVSANGFEIDGVNVNSQAWGGAAVITPNQESVKEIRVVSSSYSAETGRNSGASVQVVSQNGTNQFHGSAVMKYNTPSLNAFQRWGGPFDAVPQRSEQINRQYAGSLGGPIIKNRLFFFFSYETVRRSTNQAVQQWIETPEFVQLLQQRRPNSLASQITSFPGMTQNLLSVLPRDCASISLGPSECQALPGGIDIGSPTGALGQNVENAIGGGLDGIPDLRFAQVLQPTSQTNQQYNGRVDFRPTNNDLLAFSFYWIPSDSDTLGEGQGRQALGFTSNRRNMAGTLLWTRTFTPTIVNEARFNVTRWYFNEIDTNSNAPWGIPNVTVADNPFPFNLQWGLPGAGVFSQTSYDFRDVVSKVWGSHVLKFGGEVIWDQNNDTSAGGARPRYNFGNLWNFANDAPLTETGTFDPRNGFPTDLKKYMRMKTYNLFIQDDWKVRPNLTLNLGLRWEYFQPLHEKDGNVSNLILGPDPDPLGTARLQLGGNLWEPDRNNFGPQLGFAWTPAKANNRLVVRGGFGVGFNRIPQALTLNVRQNPPFFGNFTLSESNILYTLGNNINSFYGWPSNAATVLPIDPNTNLPTSGAPSDVFSIAQNLATPYTYRYSFELQYDLGANWIGSLGYQGADTHKYPRTVNNSLFFPRNPRLQTVNFVRSDVNSNFNALLARVSHNFAKGFQLSAQYRWSKSLDTCSDDNMCIQSYPFDQRQEKALSDFDTKHNFLVSGVWDLPIFRTRTDWIGKVAGGWQLSGIMTFSTGFPWTPTFRVENCDAIQDQGGICPIRPLAYLGGAGTDYSNDTFKQQGGNFPGDATNYFVFPPNLGLYDVPPAPGIGRNSFRGPNFFSTDISAQKHFGLPNFWIFGENTGLDIRANAYNVFNQLNHSPFLYNQPSTLLNEGNFGRSTSALLGRIVEFQARFSF